MSTSSTSSKFCPSRTSIAASSTPTYAKDIHLTNSNSDSLHLVCDLCVREDQHLADQGVIQEPTDGVHCAAGSSRAAVTASLEGFLQVCEEEAQLRVVWIGSVVVSVELAVRVVVAAFLAVQLLWDVNKKFNNIFSQETFHIVSTGCAAPPIFCDAILAWVKRWTRGQQNTEIADGKACWSKMREV